MKTKIHFFHIKILILITLLVVLVLHRASAQAEPVRIAITPFTLNAPEDMGYLQSGIQDMLESRLSQDEDVIVVSDDETARAIEGISEPIDENEAREVGRRLNARYVLIGSLTVFGSSASLDARLVDVSGEKATLAFFEQSENIDDLVPKINAFAADINLKIGGAAVVAAAPKPAADGNDIQAHPEKLEPGEVQAEVGDSGLAAAGGVLSEDFWKSRNYKYNFHGLALGDVDGDGKIETVVITHNRVIIFRKEAGKLYKLHEIKQSMSKQFIGVDAGDINGNGIDEIFVSGLTPRRTGLSSFVLEHNGKAYRTLDSDSNLLYRVVETGDRPPMLFGQKFKPLKDQAGPIFKMTWSGSAYRKSDNVIQGKSLNLMGFSYGDVFNRHENGVLAYTYADRLELFDGNGAKESSGSEALGGSTLYFSIGRTGKGDEEFEFFPMRVLLKDLDRDGQQEVIAVKNYEVANRALRDFRMFTDFHVESLSWDGLGLKPNWKTSKTSGYMRDYAIGDLDNDGKDELVAAIVLKEGRIIGITPKSALVAYEIIGP